MFVCHVLVTQVSPLWHFLMISLSCTFSKRGQHFWMLPCNMLACRDLFTAIDPIPCAIDCMADCNDFDTMACYRDLLVGKCSNYNQTLPDKIRGIHPSHFTKIALHAK